MLTAKGQELDKVVGLDLGADDYVTKPFGVRELLARIHALLRRSTAFAQGDAHAAFQIGESLIDPKTFTIRRDASAEPLTARELKLAEVFAAHPAEVLTRDALLNAVWGHDYLGTTRTLDQHIAQLRKKIDPADASRSAIMAVHGVGYRYEV
jgi:DNA-binding response OmpR family regulator